MSDKASRLLEEIEFLFEKYSDELRSSTQPYRFRRMSQDQDFKYHPDSELVRESLMEHVGSLPMLAVAFYPYIKDEDVDLGIALKMLAIHDIGELIEGDQNTFIKPDDGGKELAAAKKLLNPIYHELYKDIEMQGSKSAKFAKSIDKIAPDIIDYLVPPEVTLWRFDHFNNLKSVDEIIKLIVVHKQPYMVWNPFMTEFHKLLMDKLGSKLKSYNRTGKNWGAL